jgi:hypothetical protein
VQICCIGLVSLTRTGIPSVAGEDYARQADTWCRKLRTSHLVAMQRASCRLHLAMENLAEKGGNDKSIGEASVCVIFDMFIQLLPCYLTCYSQFVHPESQQYKKNATVFHQALL